MVLLARPPMQLRTRHLALSKGRRGDGGCIGNRGVGIPSVDIPGVSIHQRRASDECQVEEDPQERDVSSYHLHFLTDGAIHRFVIEGVKKCSMQIVYLMNLCKSKEMKSNVKKCKGM